MEAGAAEGGQDGPTFAGPPDRKAVVRRRLTAAVAGLAVTLLAGWLAVTTPPRFYRETVTLRADAEVQARRFVTEVAAVFAAAEREGPWGVEMSEDAINAWLGSDLPRNHAELLRGTSWGRLSRPRVAFQPKLIRIGVEVTSWGVTAVAWADLEVSLRAANQFAVLMNRAGLGSLPLPRDAVLRECGRRLNAAGLTTEMQRFRDRSLLLVTISDRLTERPPAAGSRQPGRRWQVESLRLDPGRLTLAGNSRVAERRRTAAEAGR